jgi:hypothetical protein
LIAQEYMSAPDHKALAISFLRGAFFTDQKDDETAKAAALAACQQATDAAASGSGPPCEIYAVGTTVVSTRGRPPLPPEPWLVRDPSIETPFAPKDVPLIDDRFRGILEKIYTSAPVSKAIAIGPKLGATIYYAQTNTDEAVRRSLEWCGARAGIPCLIIAVDGVFVVPIPTTMNVVGLFHPNGSGALAQEAREEVVRRWGNAGIGWNVIAAGANGLPGFNLKAANEQQGIDGAVADCDKRDHGCRVIAIGPFAVEPKEGSTH